MREHGRAWSAGDKVTVLRGAEVIRHGGSRFLLQTLDHFLMSLRSHGATPFRQNWQREEVRQRNWVLTGTHLLTLFERWRPPRPMENDRVRLPVTSFTYRLWTVNLNEYNRHSVKAHTGESEFRQLPPKNIKPQQWYKIDLSRLRLRREQFNSLMNVFVDRDSICLMSRHQQGCWMMNQSKSRGRGKGPLVCIFHCFLSVVTWNACQGSWLGTGAGGHSAIMPFCLPNAISYYSSYLAHSCSEVRTTVQSSRPCLWGLLRCDWSLLLPPPLLELLCCHCCYHGTLWKLLSLPELKAPSPDNCIVFLHSCPVYLNVRSAV